MRILFLIACLMISACSYLGGVIPDRSKEYKKSEALPDLEIPPDLTAEARNDAMTIPGEKSASLSQYKRQRSGKPDTSPTLAQSLAGEQRLSVRGSALEIWPKLRIFFADRGYTLELDDAELGVLETNWSEPVIEGGFIYRNKFKIFSESGDTAANTLLFISGMRQEQLNKDGGEPEWIDQGKNIDIGEQLAGELNLHLSGVAPYQQSSAAAGQETPVPSQPVSGQTAEILDAGEGKFYLAIPVEFSRAWQQTEVALQRAGFIVDDKDQDRGLYFITYFDSVDEAKKGWFSKMAFWKDDESDGKVYQISLTGVGDKTEMIILNKDGDWETGNDASRIMSLIQEQYNQL